MIVFYVYTLHLNWKFSEPEYLVGNRCFPVTQFKDIHQSTLHPIRTSLTRLNVQLDLQ